MKSKSLAYTFALFVASSSAAFSASIALTFDFDSLRNSSGTPLSSTYVAVLIVDSDGDGQLPTVSDLQGVDLTVGGIVGGTNTTNGDRIFTGAAVTSGAFGFQNYTGSVTVDFTQNNINPIGGSVWGLYWFPGVTALGTTITAGTSYGFFTNSNADAAAIAAFGQPYVGMVFPAEGVPTADVGYFDTDIIDGEGQTPTANTPSFADFTASYTVIPEPASLTLSALGLAALLRRRRK